MVGMNGLSNFVLCCNHNTVTSFKRFLSYELIKFTVHRAHGLVDCIGEDRFI